MKIIDVNNMNVKSTHTLRISASSKWHQGFSLIELMVAIAIGLIIMSTLIALFINVNRTNDEMAKTNSQIENGRFSIQLLENDVMHAGFWGTYVPQFDDLTFTLAPADVATAVPNPCLPYTTPWTADNVNNLIVIPIQVYAGTPPSGAGCVTNFATNKQANTDVLVVRHAETCIPGDTNCEVDIPGKLYFHSSVCEAELSSSVQAATSTTIKLVPTASATNNFYNGRTIRILSGTGAGQSRVITAYDGSTKIATISLAWTTTPDVVSSKYAFGFGYLLDTSGFTTFHKRNCTTVAEKRKFISNIYYVRDYATTVGDGIPTLMISQFDALGTTLAQQAAIPLVEGVEGFKVELGIDSLSDNGTNVIVNSDPTNWYTDAIKWVDSQTLTSPINRGDGVPDAFVTCTDAVPCTFKQLNNVVAAKVYVLARADKPTLGYTDSKTYTLGNTTLGPFNDGFKRHVFSTSIRLTNISSRRETP